MMTVSTLGGLAGLGRMARPSEPRSPEKSTRRLSPFSSKSSRIQADVAISLSRLSIEDTYVAFSAVKIGRTDSAAFTLYAFRRQKAATSASVGVPPGPLAAQLSSSFLEKWPFDRSAVHTVSEPSARTYSSSRSLRETQTDQSTKSATSTPSCFATRHSSFEGISPNSRCQISLLHTIIR